MRALFSGVTGIRSHQVRMDVIGNNIANVNTTGFKSSRVTFMDVFSQTMSAGSAQTSPQQVGLGVGIASTDLLTTAGSLQLTGREMDLAIEGAGFFILKGGDAAQRVYTRAGNFDWDSQGFLVQPGTGQRVQGWVAAADGTLNTVDQSAVGDIQLIRGDASLARPTTAATFGQNLDAGAADGATYDTAFTAYDSLGRPVPIAMRFTKTAPNNWTWEYQEPGQAFTQGGSLSFNPDGTLPTNMADVPITINGDGGADPLTINVNMRSITQAYAGTGGSSVLVRQVDGNPMGTLESVTVDANGQVSGIYSNGTRRNLAQLAMASFNNASGLLKSGSSGFTESASSGSPVVGKPGTGGRGRLVPGNLEMSNVDLSTEFTNMIMTQRGFQANTRIISAADEMIQDLVNLRR